ncbi:MAG: 1-deoxy-D-xylulose-5-phosphate reductoisomerase [Pirellulaceae bacterium]
MQHQSPKTAVAVLGATGSIGTATIDVIRRLGAPWNAFALSAHSRLDELAEFAQVLKPELLVATCEESLSRFEKSKFPASSRILSGPDALCEVATDPAIDTVVAAVVGSAGMMSTLAAAEAGKRLALANKESLVVAGDLVCRALAKSGGELLPVDSEHSAIFQAIQAGASKDVEKIILTASGGPFRSWNSERIAQATVDDALAHPTWKMGKKITIDSATMMNKALEVIEARWLFDLPAEKIEVVVHPQSIVHSMVEFVDGSVIAQLSPPDMRLPIQYALTYPDRTECHCPKMNWASALELTFEPVDIDRFPALTLGWEVVRRGGTCGAVVNAANEAAVELFLDGSIKFTDIVRGCRRILDEHPYSPKPSLDELIRLDRWAREEINRWAVAC